MTTFIFIENKIINADNIAYINIDPGNDTVSIVLLGSNSDSYDLILYDKDAQDFLRQIKACKKEK